VLETLLLTLTLQLRITNQHDFNDPGYGDASKRTTLKHDSTSKISYDHQGRVIMKLGEKIKPNA